jgi:hypothetical protein
MFEWRTPWEILQGAFPAERDAAARRELEFSDRPSDRKIKGVIKGVRSG